MKIKIISSIISFSALMAMTGAASAAGTTANTPINNLASISYSVGGAAQTTIESSDVGNSTPGSGNGSATTFVVDKKIDLIVTAATSVNVVPNTSGNALVFSVTNEGNSAEDFSFTISEIAGGDFDATGCTASPATISSLVVDTPTNVTVTCSIPNSGVANNGGVANAGVVSNTKTSVIDLLATVTGVTASTGPEDPATMETVFADGTGTSTDGADRNAKHSATGTFIVNTADLTVQKTETVTKMAFNLDDNSGTGTNGNENEVTTGSLYHIPGSTIEYKVIITNAAGAATATGIVINDSVPATLTIVGTPTITGGTSTTASATGNAVTTAPFDLAGGQTATLTITATVN